MRLYSVPSVLLGCLNNSIRVRTSVSETLSLSFQLIYQLQFLSQGMGPWVPLPPLSQNQAKPGRTKTEGKDYSSQRIKYLSNLLFLHLSLSFIPLFLSSASFFPISPMQRWALLFSLQPITASQVQFFITREFGNLTLIN